MEETPEGKLAGLGAVRRGPPRRNVIRLLGIILDLLADLNEPQRRAVTHVDGPLLVLAGAGSGKTRVITRRVAYLVGQGVGPGAVLAITFTNKAAGEMSDRVRELGVPRGATVCTFHSLCARLLRRFADEANLWANFTIYDAADQLRCVKDAIRRLDLPAGNFPPGAFHSAISRAKNQLQDADAYAAAHTDYFGRTVGKVFGAYQRILAENRALDFDDLLMRTAFLMRDRPDIRARLGQKYLYVLIDEYQDTNHAQYVIAHGIAMDHENICATGDPDQSIYAWRGADIKNILEFEADYPNAVVVRLEANYRSVRPILTTASSLIAHNRRRKHKELLATRSGGDDVEVIRLGDEHAEAAEAADIVRRLADEQNLRYSDVAVFYRVNALSRLLEEAFRRAGIAYQIARGVEFFNRKEIKDVLAYLRVLVNPDDDLSCSRIINVPSRGIGAVTLSRLAAAAQAKGVSLPAACADPAAAGLGKAPAAKVAAFAQLMADLGAHLDRPVRAIIEDVVVRSGMEAALKAADDQRQALRNVEELITSAAEFDAANDGAPLAEYLLQVSLVSDIDSIDPAAGAVTFMTLHAAKGLEFSAVIMIGCEEGLLPFDRGDGKDRDLEEERRLAFVGMTRTKDRLFMLSARHRRVRGVQLRQVESPFLTEIGEQGVTRTDKSPPQETPRRGPVSVDEFNRRGPRGRFDGAAEERRIIEAMAAADNLPEQFAGMTAGRRVRHPKFGPGTVVTISFDGIRTRASIRFDRTGTKTLILEHAHLEPM